jgi:hypothetical protein
MQPSLKKFCACLLFKLQCQKSLLPQQKYFQKQWPKKDTAIQGLFSPPWKARSYPVTQAVYKSSNQMIS